jgi:CRISPR system Cascade subunit CasE
MYLTRMHLNPARRGTRHLLASPQRMHAAVLAAFPPSADLETADGRVLWRVDRGRDHVMTLFVSSPAEPDLTHVVEQAGWPAEHTAAPWQTARMEPLLERLETGQQWAFRLTANPVHAVRDPKDGRARGRRLAHVTVEQQRSWLAERSTGWGFAVLGDSGLTADVTSRRSFTFERRSDDVKRDVTLTVATYDGLLTVIDTMLLRRTLGHGAGRAKGYGCGLLTLAPVR